MLNLGPRRGRLVIFTPRPLKVWERGLTGSQTQCVEFIEEKVFLACRELNHDGLFVQPIV